MTRIRPARPEDLPQLVRLCVDHSAYERADPPAADLADRLGAELFVARPRIGCLVVEASPGSLVGYATGVREYDPTQAVGFLHMDCIFVDEPYRGRGLGRLLIDRLVAQARDAGLETVRWQTPTWNVDAVRFYERLGATGSAATQFTIAV